MRCYRIDSEGRSVTTPRAAGFGLEKLPRIDRGEGSYLFDTAGRRYLDGSGGNLWREITRAAITLEAEDYPNIGTVMYLNAAGSLQTMQADLKTADIAYQMVWTGNQVCGIGLRRL